MDRQIAFCTASDGTRIAYATYGSQRGDGLFLLPDIVGQEEFARHPEGRALLAEIGQGRRLVSYDGRGIGASQRDADFASLDAYVLDVEAVADAAGLDRFVLFSAGGITGPIALLYAARHPKRVIAAALWGALVVKSRAIAMSGDVSHKVWAYHRRALGTVYFPSGPIEMQRWLSDALLASAAPRSVAEVFAQAFDITPILPSITAPTLILQREGIQSSNPALATTAARLLPNSRLVTLPGDGDHPLHDRAQYMDALCAFLDEHLPRTSIAETPAGAQTAALTARETEVLGMLAGGHTAKEIAVVLDVSASTVQRHIANIYGKIGARGRVDAAAYALARGLVQPRRQDQPT